MNNSQSSRKNRWFGLSYWGYLAIFITLAIAVIILWIDTRNQNILMPDGYTYSTLALNLIGGKGYIGWDQTPFTVRPIFPILLSLAFTVFGATELAAWVTVRLIFIGILLMVFVLGRKLFGVAAGLIASLLVLTSYRMNQWASLVHLDFLIPLAVLVFLYLLYISCERLQREPPVVQTKKWTIPGLLSRFFAVDLTTGVLFFLTGLVLGAAFLVKETAILYFPLPILWLLLRKELRSWRTVKMVAVLFLGAFVLVGPWLIYVYGVARGNASAVGSTAQSIPELLLNAAPTDAKPGIVEIITRLAGEVATSPFEYFTVHLQPNFILAPLLVIAVLATAWFALRRDKPAQYLLLAIILFLPIVVLQGIIGLRSRQSVMFFLLAYLALGMVLSRVAVWLTRRGQAKHPKLAWGAAGLLVIGVIAYQFFADLPQSTYDFVLGQGAVPKLISGTVDPPLNRLDVAMGDWIRENVPPGAGMMIRMPLASDVYFFANGRNPVYGIPVLQAPTITTAPAPGQRDDVIWLTIEARGNHNVLNVLHTFSFALTEEDLYREIEEKNIEYIILTSDREAGLIFYFLNHPDFVKVGEVDASSVRSYHIFKRIADHPRFVHPDVTLGDGYYGFAKELQQSYPAIYQAMVQANFKDMLGWSDADVENMIEGRHPALSSIRPFAYDRYADFVNGNAAAIAASETISQQLSVAPNATWPYVTYGVLQERRGTGIPSNYVEAAAAYTRAFELDNSNMEARKRLLALHQSYGEGVVPDDTLEAVISAYADDVQNAPDDVDRLKQLADVYTSLGRTDEALSTCDQLIAQWPSESDGYICTGNVAMLAGDANKAADAYMAALTKRNIDSRAINDIILDLPRLNADGLDTSALATQLSSVISRDPDTAAGPLIELGKVYLGEARSKLDDAFVSSGFETNSD